ncbi:hypothetical protein [Antarctobacter heliothermus]|uniref:Uncharacterized protein n=1 Tax=Antarctobacter heliothermus TaxID=74033 RepID=A0A239K3Z5_9RHOB|nr:hypothetical protein [Antarctobacter heliothermus]SNT12392.1 hypothetical protein SAMN04488078_106024 [Antarctobacter heliothermus]
MEHETDTKSAEKVQTWARDQLTLMIAGDTQLSFKDVDEATRSRVVLVPFAATLPSEERDRGG